MSTGQKAWEEERESEAFTAHIKRLESLGYRKIVEIADDIRRTLQSLEGDLVELERLVTLAKNEARRESAKVCNRLIHGDGICADGEVWIHDCEDAILATLEEV